MCSLVQVVRVVIVRVILVGVRCVTVVHVGHDEVLVVVLKSVAIFVVIVCNWRCTLYRMNSRVRENASIGSCSPEAFASLRARLRSATRCVCEVFRLGQRAWRRLLGRAHW